MGVCSVCNTGYHHCSSCDPQWFDYWSVCSEECAYKCNYFKKLEDKVKELGLTDNQIKGILEIIEDNEDGKITRVLEKELGVR